MFNNSLLSLSLLLSIRKVRMFNILDFSKRSQSTTVVGDLGRYTTVNQVHNLTLLTTVHENLSVCCAAGALGASQLQI